MKDLPEKMSLQSYLMWLSKDEAYKVKIPNFFPEGSKKALSVILGKAKDSTLKVWESTGKRLYTAYKKRPTNRLRFALRNWGFAVTKDRNELVTL